MDVWILALQEADTTFFLTNQKFFKTSHTLQHIFLQNCLLKLTIYKKKTSENFNRMVSI